MLELAPHKKLLAQEALGETPPNLPFFPIIAASPTTFIEDDYPAYLANFECIFRSFGGDHLWTPPLQGGHFRMRLKPQPSKGTGLFSFGFNTYYGNQTLAQKNFGYAIKYTTVVAKNSSLNAPACNFVTVIVPISGTPYVMITVYAESGFNNSDQRLFAFISWSRYLTLSPILGAYDFSLGGAAINGTTKTVVGWYKDSTLMPSAQSNGVLLNAQSNKDTGSMVGIGFTVIGVTG